jgi:hypothetical protein
VEAILEAPERPLQTSAKRLLLVERSLTGQSIPSVAALASARSGQNCREAAIARVKYNKFPHNETPSVAQKSPRG